MPTPTTATDARVGTSAPGSQIPLAAERGARRLSSIGAKALMAVTGAILTVFVIAHMLGNLQIYLGPEHLNAYAARLQGMQEVVWIARLVLLTAFVTHIGLGLWLAAGNRAARPVPYVFQATRRATVASRTMLWSGLVLL